MSIESKIDDLIAAVAANTEAVAAQTAIQERLLVGQQAALEKIDGGKAAATGKGKAATSRAKKAEEDKKKPADTESQEEDAKTASTEKDVEDEDFATYAKAWLNSVKDGSAEYKRRGKLLMGILAHFGAGKMSELDKKNHHKALFFLKRDEAGMVVEFDADYDFDGDPAQDESDGDFSGALD